MSGKPCNLTPLTEAQRQFAADRSGLIWTYLRQHDYDLKEWSGIASLGYIRAVKSHKEGRGLSFSTWAYDCMRGEISHEFRGRTAQMRNATVISLDYLMEFGDGVFSENGTGCIEDEMIDTSLEDSLYFPLLTARQKEIAKLLAADIAPKFIWKKMGCCYETYRKEKLAIRAAILESRLIMQGSETNGEKATATAEP